MEICTTAAKSLGHRIRPLICILLLFTHPDDVSHVDAFLPSPLKHHFPSLPQCHLVA